ncbi:40198_t:CDS:1, partial [Gigaspora margarita]
IAILLGLNWTSVLLEKFEFEVNSILEDISIGLIRSLFEGTKLF